MKISLILSTLGRVIEVEEYIKRLLLSDYDLNKIELIIVDQNDTDLLRDIIRKYENMLNLKHLEVNFKGLSKSRNYGIKYASGEIIGFPDDDCWYEKDTLKNIEKSFNKNLDSEIILGKILDQYDNLCYMKDSNKSLINKISYRYRANSNNIFVRNSDKLKFDENFGIGAKYPASEDTDLIYTYLRENKKIIYDNNIIVRHPNVDYNIISEEKVKLYSYGYGAYCRKQVDIFIIYNLILSIAGQLVNLVKALIKFQGEDVVKRYYSIIFRMKGFIEYK